MACDDGNACTQDSCDGAGCSAISVADGKPCGTDMVCKAGKCIAGCKAGKSWVPDGTINFPATFGAAYHPFLDEHWAFSTGSAASPVEITRFAADASPKGSFKVPQMQGYNVSQVYSIAGEAGGPQAYLTGMNSNGQCQIARLAEPGGKLEWVNSYNGGFLACPLAVFRYGAKLYAATASTQSGCGAYNIYDPTTGKILSQQQHKLPGTCISAAVIGTEVVSGCGSSYGLLRYSLATLEPIDTFNPNKDFVSVIARQNRLCILKGDPFFAACYQMTKACPP